MWLTEGRLQGPRVVLAPDTFKGALSAPAAAEALARGLRRVWPDADLRLMPMADGGEGTLDAILSATGGERRTARVTGVGLCPVEAAYGLLRRGGKMIALLEAAQVVGLTLATEVPVEDRSSTGLGELVRHCLDLGVQGLLIGLGGTSTNEAGAGVLTALGARLLAADGRELAPTPNGLADLDRVDFSGLDARLGSTEIILMADVQNVLCGPDGATAIFGPQKGVRRAQVAVLDARLRHFAERCDRWRGEAVSLRVGTGAAGGLGYLFQLLGASHRSGAEVVCEWSGLDESLSGADWVITGEGRSDAQTLLGKAPWVVARHARQAGVRVTLVSGAIDEADLNRLSAHFDDCSSISPQSLSLAEAMERTAEFLADRAEHLARQFVGTLADGRRERHGRHGRHGRR